MDLPTAFGLLSTVAIVVVVGLVIWRAVVSVRHQMARERHKAHSLSTWARTQGWTYHGEGPALPGRFRGEPFGTGYGKRAIHVLHGQHRGREIIAFEYHHIERQGRSSTSYTHLVVAAPTPSPRPYLQVSLENASTRLMAMFGVRDLQLESEEFNRTFWITTGDNKFAYDVLHPRMMEWLLADQRSRRVPFRFEGNDLLCWSETEMHPGYVIWMADYLMDLAERVPSFVWR